MTLIQYKFEGNTNGSAVTAANSGVSIVSLNGGTAIYSTAAASKGVGMGVAITSSATSGQQAILRCPAAASNAKMAFSGVFSVDRIADSLIDMTTIVSLRGNDRAMSITWNNKGGIYTYDSTAAADSLKTFVADNTLAGNTKYRIEIVASGGGTTTGVVNLSLYLDSTDALIASLNIPSYNLGTGLISGADVGICGSSASAHTVTWDNIQFNDGATTEIGPATTSGPLTVNAGLDQSSIEPFSTVTLAATAANPGGTVSGIAWTQVSGPTVTLGGTGATRTFEAPGSVNGATLVFRATATGS